MFFEREEILPLENSMLSRRHLRTKKKEKLKLENSRVFKTFLFFSSLYSLILNLNLFTISICIRGSGGMRGDSTPWTFVWAMDRWANRAGWVGDACPIGMTLTSMSLWTVRQMTESVTESSENFLVIQTSKDGIDFFFSIIHLCCVTHDGAVDGKGAGEIHMSSTVVRSFDSTRPGVDWQRPIAT